MKDSGVIKNPHVARDVSLREVSARRTFGTLFFPKEINFERYVKLILTELFREVTAEGRIVGQSTCFARIERKYLK
jgi:hypothetical protein